MGEQELFRFSTDELFIIFLNNNLFDLNLEKINIFHFGEMKYELPFALRSHKIGKGYVHNLFETNKMFSIINKESAKCHFEGKRYDFNFEALVMIDTQAISYLVTIFENQKLSESHIEFLNYMLHDQINYDCQPYLLENCNKIDSSSITKIYNNLICFERLKHINKDLYFKTGKIEFVCSEMELMIKADALLSDMCNFKYNEFYTKYFDIYNSIYILLMKSTIIEFKKGKRSFDNKMEELLIFVNENILRMEREMISCLYFFKHEKVMSFFKKIKPNNKNILGDIKGMAWDFVHIRQMEAHTKETKDNQDMFGFSSFLSFDLGIKEIIDCYSIDKILISDQVYFHHKQNIIDIFPNSSKFLKHRSYKPIIPNTNLIEELELEIKKYLQGDKNKVN